LCISGDWALKNIKIFYRRVNICEVLFASLAGAFAVFVTLLSIEEMTAPLYTSQLGTIYLALPAGFCIVFAYVVRHRASVPRKLMLKLLSCMLLSLALMYVII
jgi:TRAP-type C4-dicarboxylate transport system permease small subunit